MLRDWIAGVLVASSVALTAAPSLGQVSYVLPAPSAAGQAVDERLARMQQEIDVLRGDLARAQACGECTAEACGSSCRGLYAGSAVVFAKPHYKESFQATSLSLATGQMDLDGFGFDYGATPRIWLGYGGGEAPGVRATYWQFDHAAQPGAFVADGANVYSAQAMTVIFPAYITAAVPGDRLDIASALAVQTFDLEGTQELQVGCCQVTAAAGLRYAWVEQTSSAAVTSGGITTQQLSWSRTYHGIGPTVAVEMRRPLGWGGLEFVGAGRGSLLYGKKDLRRQISPLSLATPPLVALNDADDVAGCGSLELGIQWARPLARGGQLFVRGSYEGQLWTEGGAPTLTFLGFEGFGLNCGISR